jgi:glycosyltransferase involved in cell wall biosynthesis
MQLSLVTPSLNRVSMVRRAIESVGKRCGEQVQHLIIDGGSEDGSLELFRQYPHLEVVVEPDRNVYDAFNKGVKRARGEIVGILNSDDYLAQGAIDAVLTAFSEDPSLEWFSAGAGFFAAEGDPCRDRLFEYLHPELLAMNPAALVRYPGLVNARFFRRSWILEHVGDFDVEYPVVADRDWLIRAALARPRQRVCPRVLYHYGVHARSISHRRGGVGATILSENLRCAAQRWQEAGDEVSRRAYRFWWAWSAMLWIASSIRNRSLKFSEFVPLPSVRGSLGAAGALPGQVLRHWSERRLKLPDRSSGGRA